MRLFFVILLSMLCGCSTLKTIVEPNKRVPLNLTMPPAIDMEKVEFVVIHKDNAKVVFEQLEKKNIQPVVFALTADDYKALAINASEIKSYLLLQRKIILLYQDYYEGKND